MEQLRDDIARNSEDPDAVMKLVVRFAEDRRLSPNLVIYRSLRAGFVSQSLWNAVGELLEERFRKLREQKAEKEATGGGGDFYTTRRHRLGSLVGFARRALNEGSLTPTKAALVLGVKPRMVRTLVEVG